MDKCVPAAKIGTKVGKTDVLETVEVEKSYFLTLSVNVFFYVLLLK